MNNEEVKIINISNLIALCYVIDYFEEFNKNVIKFFKQKDFKSSLDKLYIISLGEKCFNSRKEKNFYKENKEVIDLINKYSDIRSFITFNYIMTDKLDKKEDFDFFNQYLLKNQKSMSKIISLLKRIKKLGFYNVEFLENTSFSDEEFNIDEEFWKNYEIAFLDNIELIPNCQNSDIKYKTNDSSYKMLLRTRGEEFSKYGRRIIVNNLLFDKKRLPQEITKEEVFDLFLKLNEGLENDYNYVKTSAILGGSIELLYQQLRIVNNEINNLENIEDKEELLELLKIIKNNIKKLKRISNDYDSTIINKIAPITEEILEQEKQLYLRKRTLL